MAGEIEAAARVVARDGVIVYPTDTLWGLGASVRNEKAVRRVFEVKRRPASEPLSIAVGRVEAIHEYAVVSRAAQRLLSLLPGPMTLVLEKRDTVPDVVTGGRPDVGVRVPAHDACLRMLALTGALTTTSANLHGAPDPRTLGEVRATFGEQVDFYLDSNSPPIGAASTIVDARSDSVQILRSGAVRESRIRELLVD